MRRWIFMALLLALPAHAQEVCDPDLGDDELTACLYAAFERADSRLNEVWQDLNVDRMSRNEQQAWVEYRDATCDQEMVIGGGKESMRRAICLRRMTEDRIRQLERYSR